MDWYYIRHACSHYVTWIIPESDFMFKIIAVFPCPWCDENRKSKEIIATNDIVEILLPSGTAYVFQGWSHKHKDLNDKATIKPPYSASFTSQRNV